MGHRPVEVLRQSVFVHNLNINITTIISDNICAQSKMGNDGGSIPKRRELVKEAARDPTASEIKEARQEQQEYHWTTDPISQEPLAIPIVADCNGQLYNKSTILEFLVEGSRKEDAEAATQGTVKSLKDVVQVNFEVDSDAPRDSKTQAWKCPVTGSKLGPGSKAVFIVPCGHAFSGVAIKEVSGEKCMTCDSAYAPNDIIPILPIAETDIARLTLRMKTLQEKGLTHSLKAASGSKKRKKRDETANAAKDEANVCKATTSKTSTPVDAEGRKNGTAGINNSSAASVATKVMQDQEISKKRKANDNIQSLFTKKDKSNGAGNNSDFMTRGFSLGTKG